LAMTEEIEGAEGVQMGECAGSYIPSSLVPAISEELNRLQKDGLASRLTPELIEEDEFLGEFLEDKNMEENIEYAESHLVHLVPFVERAKESDRGLMLVFVL